jgi:hypothetical protein
MLGDHGMLGKQVLYEESVRVPLLMRLPGTITARATVSSFSSTLDIVPTILDFLISSNPSATAAADSSSGGNSYNNVDNSVFPLTRRAGAGLVGRSWRAHVLTRGAQANNRRRQSSSSPRLFLVAGGGGPAGGHSPQEEAGEDFVVAAEINADHFMVRTADWKMIFDVSVCVVVEWWLSC